jgi:hypothetical protein
MTPHAKGWTQDGSNRAKRVNRYGWTLTVDDYGFLLEPVYEAAEWMRRYRADVEHCSDGATGLVFGSANEADKVVDRWVDHCVAEWMIAERERLEAMDVLDRCAEKE